MRAKELSISGAFEFETNVFRDNRGSFAETFRTDSLIEVIGHQFELCQMNTSVSQRGALRGIHFAEVPKGQAKYVTVAQGRVLDFVVDIRIGSPTFGSWQSVEVSSDSRNAIYLSEGLGHAFLSLENDTVVNYLVSDIYRPDKEHGINPLDPKIGLSFPLDLQDLVISEKDLLADSLETAQQKGLLPNFTTVNSYLASKKKGA